MKSYGFMEFVRWGPRPKGAKVRIITDNTGTLIPSMSILESRFMLTFRLPTTSSLCKISNSKIVGYFSKVEKIGIRKIGIWWKSIYRKSENSVPSSKHADVISVGCISEANLQKSPFGCIKSVSISVEFGFNRFWTTKSISILLLSKKYEFKPTNQNQSFISCCWSASIEEYWCSTCLVQ